jgi:hypothetical protein
MIRHSRFRAARIVSVRISPLYMLHLLLQLLLPLIITQNHMETIFGPIGLARRCHHVENRIMVLSTCGDHCRHHRHIITLKMNLWSPGAMQDKNPVEVEEDGGQVLECLDD